MSDSTPTTAGRTSTSRAVRQHLGWVVALFALGLFGGYHYVSSQPATYTSSTRVLVNPSDGNPFLPTPSAVRQDEPTSLETEAQVATSAEVLASVAADHGLTVSKLQKGLAVTVPPNTQILEIAFTSTDRDLAQAVSDDVAKTYLANRTARFNEVNQARIDRVETHTAEVVQDLQAAAKGSHEGSDTNRTFQVQMADALRNELVSLRAQRIALDNAEAPSGSIITPASRPALAGGLTTLLIPIGGALLGILLGCLVAVGLERLTGKVRSSRDVLAAGLPVLAEVPKPSLWGRLRRTHNTQAVDTTVRRLRATILELDPRPDVVVVSPAGKGPSNRNVTEAVAASFAKAGHRVALVRTDSPTHESGLGTDEKGLAQVLLHERLDAVSLLQPTVDPLLSILPDGGFTAQSRELLVADRLRAVLAPLTDTGHLVVVQAPGLDSPEAEAFMSAGDLGLVLVTLDRTLPRDLEQAAAPRISGDTSRAAVVLGRRDRTGQTLHVDLESDGTSEEAREPSGSSTRRRARR